MSGAPTMHVLGLDVSLRSTGWAALSYEDGALIDCGVITSKVTDAYAETLLDISTDVTAIARRYPHADIAIEEGICYRSGTTTRRLAGAWAAAAIGAMTAIGAPVAEINVKTVKKLATGKGSALKAEVIKAAVDRWGGRAAQQDIADACWVAEAHRLWLHNHFDTEGDIA